jgi:hypothetical protein
MVMTWRPHAGTVVRRHYIDDCGAATIRAGRSLGATSMPDLSERQAVKLKLAAYSFRSTAG